MAADTRKVKLLCSFDGAIHRRPNDGALRYVGGTHRLLNLRRSSNLSDLSSKVSTFFPPPFSIKYQLPGEDLDALISISTPEDLDNMMEEFDRVDAVNPEGSSKIRLFLFSPSDSGQELILDIGRDGYIEAINGGIGILRRKDSIASYSSNEGMFPGSYQDQSKLGFIWDNSLPEMKQTLGVGHPGMALLNLNANAPTIHPVGNLSHTEGKVEPLLERNPNVVNQEENPQKTGQKCNNPEESLPPQLNETLIPPKNGHQGVQLMNPNSYVHPVYLGNITMGPNQGKMEPYLEENAYRSGHNCYYNTNNNGKGFHNHQHQPLSQFPPLHPQYIMQPLPQPGLRQLTRLDDCQMCHKKLPHCHSDMLINEHGNGNANRNENRAGGTTAHHMASTLLSHNSEDPTRLEAAHRAESATEPRAETYIFENQRPACQNLEAPDVEKVSHPTVTIGMSDEVPGPPRFTSGGLVDTAVEPSSVSIQHGAYGVGQVPQESASVVPPNVEALGHSRLFAPPSTMGMSSETQSSYGVLVNQLIPSGAWHEGSLQRLPFTNSTQICFDGSSVKNVNFLVTESQCRVSVPEVSYGYVRPINGMMEGIRVSPFELTGYYEQQKPPDAVNLSTVRDFKSGNLPTVENYHAIRSQVGASAACVDNASISPVIISEGNSSFISPVIVLEGNSVRSINQLPPGAMDLKKLEQHLPVVVDNNVSVNPQVSGNAFAKPEHHPPLLGFSKPEHQPPLLVENDVAVRGQVGGNGFAASRIVPEGNPARTINHMPPSSMDFTRMQNLQPPETFQELTIMATHVPPLFYSQEMSVEPGVPNQCFVGMPTYAGCIEPAYSDNFNGHSRNNISNGDWKDESSWSSPKGVLNNIEASLCGKVHVQQRLTDNVEQMVPPSSRSDKVSSKDFVVPLDSCSENCQVYNKGLHQAEEGGFHYPQNSMTKDSCLEPIQFPQGEEHSKQDMQVVAEQVVASILQSSLPTAPTFLYCERKDSDPQSNRESGLLGGNASSKSGMSLGEHKNEDMKSKQSDKTNLGLPVTDNIGRLQIIKNSDLEELRELGSGTFGTVYHGKWRGSDVAIKRINNRCFAGKPSEGERMRADFWNEACKLADLHHPNVVASYGVVLDGPGGSYATVTEFMVNGSLRQAIQRNDRSLDRRKRLLIAMDVAFGMEYLHDKNIIHFDLKSDNLLVNFKDSQRPICKVADLGLSKVKCQTLISGGVRGTLPWMAPELLSGSTCLVSEKVDVFSFGIVMWELLTGEEPYADLHYGAIIGGIVNNTLRPPVPEACDPDWRSLMEQCWSSDPSERPNFTEIASRLRSMAPSPPRKG